MKKIITKHFFLLALLFGTMLSVYAQKDTIPPQITVLGDTSCIGIGSVWVEQLQLSDNQSDLMSITLSKTWGSNGPVNTLIIGKYPVTYVATDSNGNKTTRHVVYTVEDCIAPVINLNTADLICHQVGTPYNPVQPTATDNYYPSNQISLIKKSSDVNPNVKGLYTEVYEATDGNGNKTTKTRIVKVDDCGTAGLNPFESGRISVFPNPANSQVSVNIAMAGESVLNLYAADGRLVLTLSLQQGIHTIQTDQMADGVYSVQIANGNALFVAKVIVQKL